MIDQKGKREVLMIELSVFFLCIYGYFVDPHISATTDQRSQKNADLDS